MPEDLGTTRKVTTRVPENGYFYISTKEWLSCLSECILIWYSCGTKAEISSYEYHGWRPISCPYQFYHEHLHCRKLDSFGLVFVFFSLRFVQMSCWWSSSWTRTSLFTACIFHECGVCAWYISWVFLVRRNVIQVSSRLYQVKSLSWQKVCTTPSSNLSFSNSLSFADKIGNGFCHVEFTVKNCEAFAPYQTKLNTPLSCCARQWLIKRK